MRKRKEIKPNEVKVWGGNSVLRMFVVFFFFAIVISIPLITATLIYERPLITFWLPSAIVGLGVHIYFFAAIPFIFSRIRISDEGIERIFNKKVTEKILWGDLVFVTHRFTFSHNTTEMRVLARFKADNEKIIKFIVNEKARRALLEFNTNPKLRLSIIRLMVNHYSHDGKFNKCS